MHSSAIAARLRQLQGVETDLLDKTEKQGNAMQKRQINHLARNSAAFLEGSGSIQKILEHWIQTLAPTPNRLLVIATPGSPLLCALPRLTTAVHCRTETPDALGLLAKPFSISKVEAVLLKMLSEHTERDPVKDGLVWGLVFDMDWALLSPSATANVSVWGGSMERLLHAACSGILSVYHRRHMPERVLQSGLHAHTAVVAEDGPHANPYHLPASVVAASATRERVDHWLGFISDSLNSVRQTDPAPAGGTALRLLADGVGDMDSDTDAPESTPPVARDERWKVRCFGGLRIYRSDGQRINWGISAGASRKVRCIFALLLLRGSKGATAEELIDMLWPTVSLPAQGMNRLHHTINSLRHALAPESASGLAIKAREHPYLVRQDQRYVLRPPSNTWIDVEDFEQLCRQGGNLLHEGALKEALMCLESALNLYSGDLFEDLPVAFTESKDPDWCWSKRYWFREMYFKIHRDCASLHRLQGNYLQAIQHCQKALERDPACEIAHGELMRIFATQLRHDALDRQFRLYSIAVESCGSGRVSAATQGLYQRLRTDVSTGKPQ